MKHLILIIAFSLTTGIAFAADSQVEVMKNKDGKAIKISGPAAKEIYETLTKLSAHGDYKYGTGVTCTSSSKTSASGYQCAVLIDGNGIK